MDTVAVACGNGFQSAACEILTHRDGIEVISVADSSARQAVDPVLTKADGRRLVIVGTDADLAGVVSRLIRTERLTSVEVGFVAVAADSVFARLWGLPHTPDEAVEVAVNADTDPVPVLRDDVGGVLVGLGRIAKATGVAYCDSERILDGPATIEVRPHREAGLQVDVSRRGVLGRRVAVHTGRAMQLACAPTTVLRDGSPHPREMATWTWYRNVDDLRLAGATA